MAADRIIVNKTNRTQAGSQAIAVANAITDLQNKVAALNAIAGHGVNVSDYTVLEADFSLAPGAGANFATLLGLINTILNTNTDVTGANRLSQLNEYAARLAAQ